MRNERLKEFYKTSTFYLDGLLQKQPGYFAGYVDLIGRSVVPGCRLLDLGAGTGQSSVTLSERWQTVTVDISWLFLNEGRRRFGTRGRAVAGDVERLPFGAATFDVVGACDLVEHVGDIETFLEETDRVLRPGGTFVVVSPNLMSPINPMLCLFRESGRGTCDLLIETLQCFCRTGDKLLRRTPSFVRRRVPDRADLHSDQDACYAASPVDLKRWFSSRRYEIVRYQSDARSRGGRLVKRLLGSYAPTIYFAAQKPQ